MQLHCTANTHSPLPAPVIDGRLIPCSKSAAAPSASCMYGAACHGCAGQHVSGDSTPTVQLHTREWPPPAAERPALRTLHPARPVSLPCNLLAQLGSFSMAINSAASIPCTPAHCQITCLCTLMCIQPFLAPPTTRPITSPAPSSPSAVMPTPSRPPQPLNPDHRNGHKAGYQTQP
jgi:hypothetical protein